MPLPASVPPSSRAVSPISAALLQSAQSLEHELEASLRAHASQSAAALDAHLTRALRALAPLEGAADAAQQRVDAVVTQAEKDLQHALSAVLAQMQGVTMQELVKRVAAVREEVTASAKGGVEEVIEKEEGNKKIATRSATRSRKSHHA